MDSIQNQVNQAKFRKPLLKGVWATFPIFFTTFKKPLSFGATAFFPGFISVQHQASSRAPMNGSLASSLMPQGITELSGRVFLNGSLY
ncbi:hypothetical protein G6657_07610 [Polynucleobacter paneuropaeus]|nr:hypothetical protein [Polynucleobacter paneuropaeus]